MTAEVWLAGAILVALTVYVLSAGADFGGGVWDLLATGPRARAQRDLIAHAIGPIWEANHVWLVLVVVLLFAGFPSGFAALCTALHVPLSLMLLGIVLRGSAFTFRSYGRVTNATQALWGRVFAVASLLTPVTLGASVGAIASGTVHARSDAVATSLFASWTAPFPVAIGLLSLALFAFLAAVYLTNETAEDALREDFRRRALVSGVALGGLAFTALALAGRGAPLLYRGLAQSPAALAFQATTGVCALGALAALWTRRYVLARALAVGQAALIVWGWGGSQFPFLIPPDLTLAEAAAPPRVLTFLLATLGAGAVVLAPSLVYLFRVFKAAPHPH